MIETVLNKHFPLKKQYKNAPERPSIKHTRNFEIILDQRPLKLKPLRKLDAEIWKWVLFKTEHTRSDAMLRRATRALRSIQNIRTLYLNNLRSSITDSGLRHLCDSLKMHENLLDLRISVSGCSLVTDKGLDDLGQSLKRLSRLESLSLNFAGYWTLTSRGVSGLSKGLKTLVNLRKICLNFADCLRVQDLAIEGIK